MIDLAMPVPRWPLAPAGLARVPSLAALCAVRASTGCRFIVQPGPPPGHWLPLPAA